MRYLIKEPTCDMKQLKTYSFVLSIFTVLYLCIALWLIGNSAEMEPRRSWIIQECVYAAYALAVTVFCFWIAAISRKGSKLVLPAVTGGVGYLAAIVGGILTTVTVLQFYKTFEMNEEVLKWSGYVQSGGIILFALALAWLSLYFRKASAPQILGFVLALILIAMTIWSFHRPDFGDDWERARHYYQMRAYVMNILEYSTFAAFFFAFSRIKA